MKKVWAAAVIALPGLGNMLLAQQVSSPAQSPTAAEYRSVLNKYCVTCHNERLKTASLTLDKIDLENIPASAEIWEKVIRKLRGAAMPPAGLPRPDKSFYDSFPQYLETALDTAAAAKLNPGRPAAVHRLNRAEYASAVHDLLALDIEAESILPPDESGYGFDNNPDVLSVSPLFIDRYESAARKISRFAVGDPSIRADSETFNAPHAMLQGERMSEDLPFGSRGGIAARYHFPLDGEYLVTINLKKNDSPLNSGSVIGLAEPHQMEVRVDRALVKRLTVGGEEAPKAKPGVPVDPHMEKGDGIEARFQAKAGNRVVGVAFVNEFVETEADSEVVVRPPIAQLNDFFRFQDGEPSVEGITVAGPFNPKGAGDTPSRRAIFICKPTNRKDEEPCARKIVSSLAHHAYRRPVTAEDLQPLMYLYRNARRSGNFEQGIESSLRGILVSPKFLFRIERDPINIAPNTPYKVNDIDLASRLSFFLWSSIPDTQLLELAEAGKLKEPKILEQQVKRMLADPKAKALMANFFGQWLQLRNLTSAQPDVATFTDYDDNLREAFLQEMQLFLENMLREDRSLVDLLDAKYTFVNDRLARQYGIPNLYGSFFRRVELTDERRWGLLGKGGILMLTSYPNRTSPVLRGKFVLENIMGTPPPPPPPNVPPLKETGNDGKKITVRQMMEQHRANPACASCHARMDPLGFAMENFDAIGRWRTMEENAPIDTSGTFPDGSKFQGILELRKILMSHPERFVATVTENLMTYALGRGVEYYDQPAIRKIVQQAAPGGYRWSSIVLGIVNCVPFEMRNTADALTAQASR